MAQQFGNLVTEAALVSFRRDYGIPETTPVSGMTERQRDLWNVWHSAFHSGVRVMICSDYHRTGESVIDREKAISAVLESHSVSGW